jgi:HPt (histidine-containing phosphotransfer) domain-containing protein
MPARPGEEPPAVADEAGPALPAAETGPMDITASQERAGDVEFWRELALAFMDETRERLEALQRALTGNDAEVFTREAHTLKGSCAELCVEGMRVQAYELEQRGKTGQLAGSAELLAELRRQFQALEVQLAPLLGRLP